jgi:hypothetical protein
MAKQIIYFKYAVWVFIYTILFALSSILYGKFLDYLAIKYDEAFLKNGEKKHKPRLILEVCVQLGATSVGVYIFREFITYVIRSYFDIEKSPDEFAALVVAPVIFSQQPFLMEKVSNIFEDIF